MKKILGMSLVAASVAMASGDYSSTADEIAHLQKQIDKLKVKLGKVNAQSANDNIKWGVDFRTAIDSVNYDLADGSSASKNDLMSMRLWLNMAYSPDSHNVFKGQLSMNKAFGADFYNPLVDGHTRAMSLGGSFDWTGNEALTDNSLKVRQAEFDGLSSKLDLSNITGVAGMSFKICMGQGSTNAQPLFESSTPYANDSDQLTDIKLAGFIFEPYNDGQIITKLTWFRAFDLPGMEVTGTWL